MVSRVGARQGVALAACAAANAVVVAVTAATHHTSGALATIAALVLAPLAVLATAAAARRVAGGWFPVAAAATLVLLPILAERFMLGTYRTTFGDHALPALVGLTATGTASAGVAVAALLAVVPRRAAAAAGVVAAAAALVIWGAGDVTDLRGQLHETVWSVTLLYWLVAAGIVAAALRAPVVALGLGGWLVAAILWAAHGGYDGAGFWRGLAVAVPAAAILLSSLGLLVPPLRPLRSTRRQSTAS